MSMINSLRELCSSGKSLFHFTVLFSVLILGAEFANAQEIRAVRIDQAPKIDGDGTEEEWTKVPIAFSGYFTQVEPENLQPSAYKTEIKLAYSDDAFYVFARLSDPQPKAIPREVGLRDQWEKNTDVFAFILDTYQKGQNAFYFGVTSAGAQLDSYYMPEYEDNSWDAVWKSEVRFTDDGWTAEFEIPYSAIRFPKAPVQEWGVNFIRRVQRKNQVSTWSPVDNRISGFVNQAGRLTGIKDVNPPLRLQLSPYVSSLLGHNTEVGKLTPSFGGGMDVKYGINESFTLDMSLIPDFSQVQSDNLVLNLGPYEVQYDENRPFFTEGTDLFNKGGLFYSRRVGQAFYTFDGWSQMKEGERAVREPSSASLLQAVKFSGRTKKGLGIGLFNALTDKTFLDVEDSVSGNKRNLLLDPLTNFNVLVLDQSLKNNSNISLINTNVSRFGGGRDANVLATEFRLHDKNNIFRLEGFGAYSHLIPSDEIGKPDPVGGYRYYLNAGKVSGNFQFSLSRNVESHTYDINDLGYMEAANEITHSLYTGYHIFQPFWVLNRLSFELNTSHSQLYFPSEYASFNIGGNYWLQFKNFWNTGAWLDVNPVDNVDFFEPRREGYYFIRKPGYSSGVWLESDGRKRFSFYGEFGWFKRSEWDSKDFNLSFSPRLRVSDRFSVSHQLNISQNRKEKGYVDELDEETILFGQRGVNTLENISNFNFIFSSKMGVSFRFRHYWSTVGYHHFYWLERNGGLLPATGFTGLGQEGETLYHENFNAFNLDLVYNWQIAPGSFLTFSYKKAIYDSHQNIYLNYGENWNQMMRAPQQDILALKISYFLDYPMLKRFF